MKTLEFRIYTVLLIVVSISYCIIILAASKSYLISLSNALFVAVACAVGFRTRKALTFGLGMLVSVLGINVVVWLFLSDMIVAVVPFMFSALITAIAIEIYKCNFAAIE